MSHDEIDPLTAPYEQVVGTGTPATPDPVTETPFVEPATPPEFQQGTVSYGDGGPVPVPPLEEARTDQEEIKVPVGSACECGRWQSVNPATGAVEEEPNCGATTRNANSRFAPGHDARLKGMLIRAGERGWRSREIGTHALKAPTTVAVNVSTAMARRVSEGIKRRKR